MTTRADGRERLVGVEIELQGVAVEEIADITADVVGGDVRHESQVEFHIDTPDGDYRVEVDFLLLQRLAQEKGDADAVVDLLGKLSAALVPCEIVTPPLPMRRLPENLDALVERLRAAGAAGTRQSVFYAFGVHLNVEPPTLDADTITRYLRAFICLYDYIVHDGRTDLSRRITPFIDRYPRDYELLVADPGYAPDSDALIEDYLRYNPTRDRALDLLPILSELDETAVQAVVDDPLVKKRPAFHYRLANSCIDEPGWSIASPWNRWVWIDELANDEQALSDCAGAYTEDRRRLLRGFDQQWLEKVQQWLPGRSSA